MKRFKSKREKPSVNSQINVTSLVDVMLVLLIIFILIAPLIEHGISISLPKASPSELESPDHVIKVTDKEYLLDENPVELSLLGDLMSEAWKSNPKVSVSIEADSKIQYQKVIDVLEIIRESKITNVALATDARVKR